MSYDGYKAEEPPQAPEELPVYLSRELRRIEAALDVVSQRYNVQFVDVTADLSAAEIIVVDASATSVVLNLPGASASFVSHYNILKAKGGNNVIIRSTETINGVGSATLSAVYQQGIFTTDGKEWFMHQSPRTLETRVEALSAQVSTVSAQLSTVSAQLSTASSNLDTKIEALSASLAAKIDERVYGASVTLSARNASATGENTMSFDVVMTDVGGFVSGNTFVMPFTAVVSVLAQVSWTSTATGDARFMAIYKNGAAFNGMPRSRVAAPLTGGAVIQQCCNNFMTAASGDYFYTAVSHNATNKDITAGGDAYSFFQIKVIHRL